MCEFNGHVRILFIGVFIKTVWPYLLDILGLCNRQERWPQELVFLVLL